MSSKCSTRNRCLLALVALFTTATKPLLGDEYQYTYPIAASTATQLLAAIRAQSTSPDGAFGYTELNTHVGWTALVNGEGTCTVETVDFTYDITIYMPEWTNKHTAKADYCAGMSRYIYEENLQIVDHFADEKYNSYFGLYSQ